MVIHIPLVFLDKLRKQYIFDKNNKKQNVSNFISIIYRSDHGGHEGRGDGSLPVIASPRNLFWVQTLSRL